MSEHPRITGVGFSLPTQIWDNTKLEQLVDTTDEWIHSRTGIRTRHIAQEKETTASLASEASRKALRNAHVNPADIDVIIVATMTPEMAFPSTACFVQDAIGAKNSAAFDISAACTGFIYALSLASSMIIAGSARHILVIGSETLSRIIDWSDRNTCVLFGDGAGAAVISKDGTGGRIVDTVLHSDGANVNLLYMPGGGSRYPASKATVNERMHFLKMTGKGLYKEATNAMAESALEVLKRNKLTVADVDLLIPHQANLRIILSTMKKLNISHDKTYINIEKYGNTSAATIPIALAEALQENRIKKGNNVVLVGFGSGMTWGATLVKY